MFAYKYLMYKKYNMYLNAYIVNHTVECMPVSSYGFVLEISHLQLLPVLSQLLGGESARRGPLTSLQQDCGKPISLLGALPNTGWIQDGRPFLILLVTLYLSPLSQWYKMPFKVEVSFFKLFSTKPSKSNKF